MGDAMTATAFYYLFRDPTGTLALYAQDDDGSAARRLDLLTHLPHQSMCDPWPRAADVAFAILVDWEARPPSDFNRIVEAWPFAQDWCIEFRDALLAAGPNLTVTREDIRRWIDTLPSLGEVRRAGARRGGSDAERAAGAYESGEARPQPMLGKGWTAEASRTSGASAVRPGRGR